MRQGLNVSLDPVPRFFLGDVGHSSRHSFLTCVALVRCAVSVNATIGFCMPTLPIAPSPFLQCSKAIGDCKVGLA